MFPETKSSSTLNRLTNLTIKAFVAKPRQPGEAPKKISDGGGLLLVVSRIGTPSWRYKYLIGGKEKTYTIGHYPSVTLEEARKQRDIQRVKVIEGQDPVKARRIRRATAILDNDNTFAHATTMWLEKQKTEWKPIHYKTSKRAIERDVLPRLGRLSVNEITSSHVSAVIEAIAKRGVVDTAYKVLQHCCGIFRMAKVKGWCQSNPAEDVSEVLPKRKSIKAMPAVLEFKDLGEILRKADAARLSPAVRMAHRLAAYSTARMGNITTAEWSEFHLEQEPALWIIPRNKMKAQDRPHDHKIILSRPIVRDLLEWRNVIGGEGYVFPTPAHLGKGIRPISRESVEKAYRVTLKLKDIHTPHGWRAAFSTLAKDNGFGRDVVELALDHIHDNDVVRAYDRGERLVDRVKLMNWWGEQLVQAQKGGILLSFSKVAA